MKRQKREFVPDDIYNLPGFLRIEVIDGEIYTDAWTALEIDEEVFKVPETEKRHIKYKLSIMEIEEQEQYKINSNHGKRTGTQSFFLCKNFVLNRQCMSKAMRKKCDGNKKYLRKRRKRLWQQKELTPKETRELKTR